MSPDTLFPKGDAEEADAARRISPDPRDEAAPVDPSLFEETSGEPPFARAVLTTPLHLVTALESRTNRWSVWNGYTVSDIFTDLGDEYRALRGTAALSDISPLVKYRISGRDAARYLDRLVTRDLTTLGVDRAVHVVFCESTGLVLGDGLLFRLDVDDYRLVTEETHLAWLLDSAVGFRVRVEDVSANIAVLSLQGPRSAFCLAEAGMPFVADIVPFAARWADIGGMPVYVSRTGATGDLGYELWCDTEDAPHVWRWLLEVGGPHGLLPAGFALRELARLEAALPRAGKDYLSAFAAVDSADALPPQAIWRSPRIDLARPLFNGGASFRRMGSLPPPRRIVPLVAGGLEPMRFGSVSLDGAFVGTATSTGFSPALGANIALAIVNTAALDRPGLSVTAEIREGLSVREVALPARVSAAPVWSHPRRLGLPSLP